MSVGADPEVFIPPGTLVLDKYRVVSHLGVGGMGIVVQATHVTLGTPVAIKFLLPQFAVMGDAARRFVREAQATSRITSDHIVRVFDTGTSTPYGPYIVMEFLEGTDLSQRVKTTGPLPIELAIDFAVQAAVALGEAHANGIVHRDVKPANLFLVRQSDGSPCVKVLDFGISKVAEETSLEVTKTTAILGSGLYMSPEQMKSAKNVDERTDVYALGISLFELLTGTQPYTAESFPDLVIKVNMEPPASIRQHRPEVAPELARAIATAYAKRPTERYQSMAELAAALAPWAAPPTRLLIDRLSRTQARRQASSPSFPPEGPEGPLYGSDLKIPRPPSLPTPESVGVDTFGLSRRKGTDPLGQTSAKTFSASGARPSTSLLGAGIGVGVVASLVVAGLYFYRTAGDVPPNEAKAESAASAGTPSVATGNVRSSAVVDALQTAAPVASSSVAPVAPASAAPSSATARPTARPSADSAVPVATVAETAAPATPTGEPAPCQIRDLDGSLKPCPK